MKKMMERFKNERGLTLVELLAVVVILAIIGTIAFVLIGNIIENSKKDAHIANAQQLIHSAKLYEVDQGTIEGSISSTDLENDGFLEPLISPWDEEDYTGTVKRTENDNKVTYSVTLKGEKCEIDDKSEEEVLKGDRDSLCD